jgi:hypothetical protein
LNDDKYKPDGDKLHLAVMTFVNRQGAIRFNTINLAVEMTSKHGNRNLVEWGEMSIKKAVPRSKGVI